VQSIGMTYWKITLAYDGTGYRGWQVQPGLATVQGLLADAIERTVGERVLPQGSGRTDAGVHALGQVASFALNAPIPAANLHGALNRCLPPSIRVLHVEAVSLEFHARHSAVGKTYEYRIFPLRPGYERETPDYICPPMLSSSVWPCPWPLDLGALNQASLHVVGTHDFTSFAASDPDLRTRSSPEQEARSNVRTITNSCWHQDENGLLIYRVTANGFLHHMVRNLVGTFVQVGAHRLAPKAIPQIIAACDRAVAGPTAPATGLFLVLVEYPNSVVSVVL
jgi:tRNA pseudouridine38-40 synthase